MNYYNPEPREQRDEACEDFDFWRKRFSFAHILFLFIGFGSFILGKPARAVLFSFAVSLFWFIAQGVLVARHMKWHIDNRDIHRL